MDKVRLLKKSGLMLLKTLRTITLSAILAATVFALVNISSAAVSNATLNGTTAPTLTTAITSPSQGAIYTVGQCFNVSATLTVSCPILIDRSPFFQTVYAGIECPVAAHNVRATISVTGNASIQGAAAINLADIACPDESGQCSSTASTSWQVCCTGPGPVTITVTPYGEYGCSYTDASKGIFDFFTKPVYALPPTYCPIPGANLISRSITITQVGINNTNNNNDNSSYSNNPLVYLPTQSNITVLTAYAQPSQTVAGQPVTIYANVANRGDTEGSFTAVLKINGVAEETRTGRLKGNTGGPLEFTVYRTLPGIYAAEVNGRETYFTITENNKESAVTGSQQLILIIGGILVITVIAALAVYIVRRREPSY